MYYRQRRRYCENHAMYFHRYFMQTNGLSKYGLSNKNPRNESARFTTFVYQSPLTIDFEYIRSDLNEMKKLASANYVLNSNGWFFVCSNEDSQWKCSQFTKAIHGSHFQHAISFRLFRSHFVANVLWYTIRQYYLKYISHDERKIKMVAAWMDVLKIHLIQV